MNVNYVLENIKDLGQPGQFASNRFVTLKNGEKEIKHVRIIEPFRKYNQVEISKTDSYTLKLNPPVRDSGDLEGSEAITLIGDEGEVHLDKGCIIANRHIHITPDEVIKYGFQNTKIVKIKINGEKGGILNNVHLKVNEKSTFELHLDSDDGNAFDVKTGDEVEIIERDE